MSCLLIATLAIYLIVHRLALVLKLFDLFVEIVLSIFQLTDVFLFLAHIVFQRLNMGFWVHLFTLFNMSICNRLSDIEHDRRVLAAHRLMVVQHDVLVATFGLAGASVAFAEAADETDGQDVSIAVRNMELVQHRVRLAKC